MQTALDERRTLVVPGNFQQTLTFCVGHFITAANSAIDDHGYFAVALSGGSTPKAIFERLARPENAKEVDWSKVLLFWGDERPVPPGDADSNYSMAMAAAFDALPIPKEHIFRMEAEGDIQAGAARYEETIKKHIPQKKFDLVTLGMGEDGHTASLFPHTAGLDVTGKLVIANHIPEKNTWRMTLTCEAINSASHICVYVLGRNKATTLAKVLEGPYTPDLLPSQRVGTKEHPALWIADYDAAVSLNRPLSVRSKDVFI